METTNDQGTTNQRYSGIQEHVYAFEGGMETTPILIGISTLVNKLMPPISESCPSQTREEISITTK